MAEFVEIVVKRATPAGWPCYVREPFDSGFVELPVKGWRKPQPALTPFRGLQALARLTLRPPPAAR